MADPQIPADVAAALEKGNLIEAIKLLRQQKNIGLAEAKGVIEAIQRQAAANPRVKVNVKTTMGPPKHAPAPTAIPWPVAGAGETQLSPGQQPRTGAAHAVAVVLVLVGLAIAAAILFKLV